MDAGIVPVRGPQNAKRRLGDAFADADREAIARALVKDALRLCASTNLLRWWVVSDDEEVLAAAREAGFGSVKDEGTGLNEALDLAIGAAEDGGAESVTIIPGDVPLAWKGDIEDLLDTGAISDVVVVPSGSDGGTNGLYISPPRLIAPRFGPSSLQAHIESAERGGYRCSVLPLPRLALDVDTLEDVDQLLARPATEFDGATVTLLRSIRDRAAQTDAG